MLATALHTSDVCPSCPFISFYSRQTETAHQNISVKVRPTQWLVVKCFHRFISSGTTSDFLTLTFQSLSGWTENEPCPDDTLLFQLPCLRFSPCRWEKRRELPAPAITQPSAINHEPQHGWFMMLLALVASSNMAWLKSPHILVPLPLSVGLAFPSSLIASFSDLHLSFLSQAVSQAFSISLAISFFSHVPSLRMKKAMVYFMTVFIR